MRFLEVLTTETLAAPRACDYCFFVLNELAAKDADYIDMLLDWLDICAPTPFLLLTGVFLLIQPSRLPPLPAPAAAPLDLDRFLPALPVLLLSSISSAIWSSRT